MAQMAWVADIESTQGTSSKTGICDTCGEGLQNCNGHFGHVRLALPAFHIGYLKLTQMFLQNICKVCNTFYSGRDMG